MLKELNLQFFAEAEEEELDDYFIEDEEDLEEIEDQEEEDPEEEEAEEDEDLEEEEAEEEEDENNPSLDKKTKAIIRHKKENQELRRKLQEYEEKEQERELERQNSLRVRELQSKGYSPEEAKSIANSEMDNQKLRSKITYMELEKLENKYPGITRYSTELSKDKEALPEFTYEQLYMAKYYKQSEYDSKTQMEQELLHKVRRSKQKSLEPSNPTGTKGTSLSQADEKVYKLMKKSNPSLTKKKFLELLSNDLE